jgi:hypothetical protein
MWDPRTVPHIVVTPQCVAVTPHCNNCPCPITIIEDNDHNTTSQSQPPPRTRAQHWAAHVHLINSAISDALMPKHNINLTCKYPTHGYIAATQALLIWTYNIIPSKQPHDPLNFIGAIVDNITGDVLEYRYLKSDKHRQIWQHSLANELGPLFQEIRDIQGTDTCFYIARNKVPRHKQATYGCICCNYCPQKDEPHCTRLTIGSDKITYTGNKSTPTADLVTAKLLINSTISTPNAQFYGINLANFYLMTPMAEFEYMRLGLDLIPDEIIAQYNLHELVNEQGWVYLEIRMGKYGLPQAGILTNKLLEKRLNTRGYYQCQHTSGLWRHVW